MNHEELIEMIEELDRPVDPVQPVAVDQVFMDAIDLSHRLDEEEDARNLTSRVREERVRRERFQQASLIEQEIAWNKIKMKNVILPAMMTRVAWLEEQKLHILLVELTHNS